MKSTIRKITSDDYKEIECIANESYSNEYYESKQSLISKIENFPPGSFVADLDGIIGYIISFPYYLGRSFPINTEYNLAESPDCWYIHDVCVTKRFRNKSIASQLVKKVLNESWNVVALTSVQNSIGFWNKFGFLNFKTIEYCEKEAYYMVLIKN